MTNQYLSIKQAAQYLHVSEGTLRRWEREGKIRSYRTAGNHRRYTKQMLDSTINSTIDISNENRLLTIGYCRVSSNHQKADLQRQIKVVQNYCELKGSPFKIIKDQGSGLNYDRSGLQEVIHLICQHQCDEIVVNYQDRLVRFGFNLIKMICNENNVKLTVINQTQSDDPNQELVNDVLSIITVFSAKLYGRRSHQNAKIIKTNKELFKENS